MIILDDFLTDEELAEYQNICKEESFRYKVDSYDSFDLGSRKILAFAKQYYDFSNLHTVEMWTNYNQVTNVWHTDHDMQHFVTTQVERYPICSLVFYPYVACEGGVFETETKIVEPKTNRIVCFGPGIKHHIKPFTGDRVSVAYNPWTHPII